MDVQYDNISVIIYWLLLITGGAKEAEALKVYSEATNILITMPWINNLGGRLHFGSFWVCYFKCIPAASAQIENNMVAVCMWCDMFIIPSGENLSFAGTIMMSATHGCL